MKKVDKKEILISIGKSIFSNIPIAGTALTELVFDYNGRIRQNRLNNFIEILAEGFTQNSGINIENIQTEHFNDLFEAVLKRVFQTNSERKLQRFKSIIISELKSPTESDTINIYLDLINDLSENEIIILYHHREFDKSYLKEFDNKNELNTQINQNIEARRLETIIVGESKFDLKISELRIEQQRIKDKHESLEVFRDHVFYNLTEDKFLLYIQRLYSRALLVDSGVGRIGMGSFEMMSITEFGNNFIIFLKEFE